MNSSIDLATLLSLFSAAVTSYFWLVKSRKERPHLEFVQLSDFRPTLRNHPERTGMKRLCFQQREPGGVLAVNHSTRQNSIVVFQCRLLSAHAAISGDWGYSGEDKPPWNIGPESSLALSPACFFDVPGDFELPDDAEFEIRFQTASGVNFEHRFRGQAPRPAIWPETERQRAA